MSARLLDYAAPTPLDGADVQLTTQAPAVVWSAQHTGGDGAYVFQVDDKGVMPVTLVRLHHAGFVSETEARQRADLVGASIEQEDLDPES